ncbi:MAG: hypothetical protein V7707_03215 [Motiliproteus sp.]
MADDQVGAVVIAEEQLRAELLWQELQPGDEVLVEFVLVDGSTGEGVVELLSPGRGYLILDKRLSDSQVPQFITESNIPNRSVVVFPHCICSYRCSNRRADECTIN